MGPLRPLFFVLCSATLALAQDVPQLGVNIAPIFKDDSVSLLNITLRIQDPNAKANRTLLYFDVNRGLSPDQQYDGNGLTATDDQGLLPIPYNDVQDSQRNWVPSRDPTGEIFVNFVAEPRGDVSGIVGRNDLRSDQGGAIGQGFTFIPYPPSEEDWETTVDWDIPESAPPGTRFASSLGDAQGASATGFPAKVIHDTYFAVGQLKRWPAWGEEGSETRRRSPDGDREFGMYWIGDLPWNSSSIGSKTKEIYLGTATYFGDNESDYRVFIRHDFEAFGGVGGYKSFILEYTDGSEVESPEESLENLLSHEIIHAFAQTYPSEDIDKWYDEGIAEYLAAVGPFLGGTLDKETFIQWLNDNAQDYYSASPLSQSWKSLIEKYWTQGTMVVKAPYTRGFMYLAYVQGLIATATDDEQSLDDIIVELYHWYLDGKNVRAKHFLELLGKMIGDEAAQASFQAMTNGTTLIPAASGFASHGLEMVRQDIEKFSLGFDDGSISEKKVSGVIPGSRAAEAGVRDGDKIVDSFDVWSTTDSFHNNMQIVVDRNGTEVVINWWPRAYEKVEAWKWVEAE